jgi:hypothetical protein
MGEEAREGLRKLYDNEELHNFDPSSNIVMVIESRGGGEMCMVEMRNMYKIFGRTPEGKRTF